MISEMSHGVQNRKLNLEVVRCTASGGSLSVTQKSNKNQGYYRFFDNNDI